jgi:hypothetical protein
MPKKKSRPVEKIKPVEVLPQIAEPIKEVQYNLASAVRVQNVGDPFPCDLSAFGYGMRWPTNAIYTIPAGIYLDLINKGLKGSQV